MLNEENMQAIADVLNKKQNNSHSIYAGSGPARDVWNLSDFGFAYQITKAVPNREERNKALSLLYAKTTCIIVQDQITNYLEDQHKWDDQIVVNMMGELIDAKFRAKCPNADCRNRNGDCVDRGLCCEYMLSIYKPQDKNQETDDD